MDYRIVILWRKDEHTELGFSKWYTRWYNGIMVVWYNEKKIDDEKLGRLEKWKKYVFFFIFQVSQVVVFVWSIPGFLKMLSIII